MATDEMHPIGIPDLGAVWEGTPLPPLSGHQVYMDRMDSQLRARVLAANFPRNPEELRNALRGIPTSLHSGELDFSQMARESLEGLLKPMILTMRIGHFATTALTESQLEAAEREVEHAVDNPQEYLDETFETAFTYRNVVRRAFLRDKERFPDNTGGREIWLSGAIQFGIALFGEEQWQLVDKYCELLKDQLATVEGLV